MSHKTYRAARGSSPVRATAPLGCFLADGQTATSFCSDPKNLRANEIWFIIHPVKRHLASATLLLVLSGSGLAGGGVAISVETVARVEASGGLTYSAVTSYTHPATMVFHREYPDRTITLKTDGENFWRDEGEGPALVEGDAMLREFILGHQVHAWLLYFDEMSGAVSECRLVLVAGETVRARHVAHPRFPKSLIPCEGRPEALVMRYDDTLVRLSFSDWKEHQGREVPFTVLFDDGARTFTYRYDRITLGGD